MEAEAQTLTALRVVLKRMVRSKLGGDRAFSLLVGQGQGVPSPSPPSGSFEACVDG